MSIIFKASDHSYRSIEDTGIEWISVTTLVSHFKKPFDAKAVAQLLDLLLLVHGIITKEKMTYVH